MTLAPAFEAGTTASVGNALAQTTVSATATDSYAGVAVTPGDADTVAAVHQVNLAVGETTVSVVVTAEDGVMTRTYEVTVKSAGTQQCSWVGVTDVAR